MLPVGLEDVQAAEARIQGFAHRTPLLRSAAIDHAAGRPLLLKAEHLQRGGAFKYRGATNAVRLLSPADRARGVVTHSSGNHAQAVALAAREVGVVAHIVMPEHSPRVKRDAVASYGGRIIPCGRRLCDREQTAARILAETGGVLIHPYDDERIIAGQGTVALEILADAEVDAILAPIGGGGLLAGICVAAKTLRPNIRVFAAEPLGADDAARSLAAGRRLPQEKPVTIADGLRTGLGERNWEIIRRLLDGVLVVDEDAIRAALRLVWTRTKQFVEPSAAVAVAAALSEEGRSLRGVSRMAVVLSGGNVDLDLLGELAGPPLG